MSRERASGVPLYVIPGGGRGVSGATGPDDELVRAFLVQQAHSDGARDSWAAAAIWNRHAPMVFRILARGLGPSGGVEDVAQDVFMRVFAQIRTLRDQTVLRSFIVSIALRILKWELRRRRVRRWVRLSEWGELPEYPVRPDDSEARQALQRFYRILDTLSAKDRTLFVLRHIEGLSLGEVAVAARVSVATVKRHLAKASARVSMLVARDPDLMSMMKPGGVVDVEE
jgi:RNA polymerase sigma-70 factor (ECF subfamily)